MADAMIHLFGLMLQGQGNVCKTVGEALAKRLGVPFWADREERLLGHRVEGVAELLATRRFRHKETGEILDQDTFPDIRAYDQLTDEVWTRDHWPDSSNDIPGALAKLGGGVTGVYYHGPSMNLVLVGWDGVKVGIRSTAIVEPGRGFQKEDVRRMAELRAYVPSV